MGDGGELVRSFTGPAIVGVRQLDLSVSRDKIVEQIGRLHSPTGIIEVEFPGEPNVRNVAVRRSSGMRPAA